MIDKIGKNRDLIMNAMPLLIPSFFPVGTRTLTQKCTHKTEAVSEVPMLCQRSQYRHCFFSFFHVSS